MWSVWGECVGGGGGGEEEKESKHSVRESTVHGISDMFTNANQLPNSLTYISH